MLLQIEQVLSEIGINQLSSEAKGLDAALTPRVGGAAPPPSHFCVTDGQCNTHTFVTFYCH
ncbi:hypothetical protein CWB99_14080 [Pseudoalteromonas rubra]|uniref:Uncharacterized protein n=1 Tax=Pseudoalteromonas rubra TaxID=43658 RepID=A0A5S3WKW7_9GAMM|nr:hypothetical protein CWB99_14080 [Pseudoalteromonas rubra]TMP28937.1 hypothetical protein CWC00_20440 [Pseudoalteromonas rubra]